MTENQAPCVYPRCDDGSVRDEKTPRLTRNVICNNCRKRYAKTLDWLVQDYATIKHELPAPARRPGDGSQHVSPKAKSFGHPAQWASDAARKIADSLNWAEDDLRDYRRDEPGVHPLVFEVHVVQRAYAYLTAHFEDLCTFPQAGDLAAYLTDLHGKMRSSLGQTRLAEHLPTPCPSCDVKALVRSVGQVECANCKRVIAEEQYPFLTRLIIDDLIKAYDTRREYVGAAE